MGFDEEWAQLRSEAAARQTAGTRLNQLAAPSGGGGGSGTPNFSSVTQQKKTAAGKLEGELKTQTTNASNHADEATNTAVTTFAGWGTSAGLKKVQKTWEDQVNNLLGRLGREANGLRGAGRLYSNNDLNLKYEFTRLGQRSGLDNH